MGEYHGVNIRAYIVTPTYTEANPQGGDLDEVWMRSRPPHQAGAPSSERTG